MVKLKSKTAEELAAWLPPMMEHYVSERVKAGDSPELATRVSESQRQQFFPDGAPSPGQFVMNVVADEDVVGTLWIGESPSKADDTWFIYDIEIAKEYRGRGHGRSAMECAEMWARERGGVRVALNVFGPNLTARSLYDSLGYEVQATTMFKDL